MSNMFQTQIYIFATIYCSVDLPYYKSRASFRIESTDLINDE